jgi:hypothetical protein
VVATRVDHAIDLRDSLGGGEQGPCVSPKRQAA